MECCESGAMLDEELLAYLAGEQVRPAVVHHLANCAACSARLNEYKRMELTLTSKLYRWDCPSSQVIGEFELGLLRPELVQAVKAHVSLCVQCAAEVAVLTNFMAHELIPAEVPAILARPQAFSSGNAPTRSVAESGLTRMHGWVKAGFRRIVATLVPPQPRLAFQREIAPVSTWPRRYTAEDFIISLQLEPEMGAGAGSSLQLIGLVTRQGTPLGALEGIPVALSTQGKVVARQQIDELGNFVFMPVPETAYSLELQFPECTVVLEDLEN